MCALVLGLVLVVPPGNVSAQTFPTSDPILEQIWQQGMEHSQLYTLAQALMDSIGPRLTGSPELLSANEWAVAKLESWGIEARNEQYGTWMGWTRGISHVDLLEPRVRSLNGMMLAWSPGTDGKVTGEAVILPELASVADLEAWLPEVRGTFVLMSMAQPTCRPDANWEEFAMASSFQRMRAERSEAQQAWRERTSGTELSNAELVRRIEDAGALGILTSNWPGAWGTNRIFSASTEKVPTFDVSCEDYGLVYRLAAHGQHPVLQMEAESDFAPGAPLYNTIGEIRGTEKPDEYVLLSAHYDAWDGGSGATDNGTGSVTMMEAMRILKAVYPNPKRTIIMGLWNSEEQGLNGSRAFAADHPDVVEGMQALFNQDNGTGRIVRASTSGLPGAAPFFARWFAALPQEISQHIDLSFPGNPSSGGTDHASFVCAGAPAFSLGSLSWDYFRYTWHTNLDTFDKLVFDDLKNNATLVAMLAYMASEEPERIPRDQRVLPVNPRTGEQREWPTCREPTRSWEAYRNR
jgi:hypothetical protein